MTETIWKPQPGPQTALIKCPIFIALFGGARGGGKTDAMIGDFMIHANRAGGAASGIFIRRELPQLDDAIKRTKDLYPKVGATYNEQRKTWTFPNGATLRFRALDRDEEAEKYQGHSYTRIYWEELSNFPNDGPFRRMIATVRSATTTDLAIRATANPGGPGHLWVKRMFIDPAPDGYRVIEEDGLQRVFIPSRIQDNAALLKANPGYIDQLKHVGSETLVRAWLEGDWNVVEGAFFDVWEEKRHVIEPFRIPDHWTLIGSFDWGSAKPASYGLWAISDGDLLEGNRHYPRGAMIRIAEDYMASEPDVGLRLPVEEVAARIRRIEAGRKIRYRSADPAIFKQDGGPSMAERFARSGVAMRPADNKRLQGWSKLRDMMVGEDGIPQIYCFSTCTESRRIIPAMQHDPVRPEDINTKSEDHIADEWRYAVMSRPSVKDKPEQGGNVITFKRKWELSEIFDRHIEARRRAD